MEVKLNANRLLAKMLLFVLFAGINRNKTSPVANNDITLFWYLKVLPKIIAQLLFLSLWFKQAKELRAKRTTERSEIWCAAPLSWQQYFTTHFESNHVFAKRCNQRR